MKKTKKNNIIDEWLDKYGDPEIARQAELRLEAIAFHKWMRENDTMENAEQYFHYTDEDMYNEYLKSK